MVQKIAREQITSSSLNQLDQLGCGGTNGITFAAACAFLAASSAHSFSSSSNTMSMKA